MDLVPAEVPPSLESTSTRRLKTAHPPTLDDRVDWSSNCLEKPLDGGCPHAPAKPPPPLSTSINQYRH